MHRLSFPWSRRPAMRRSVGSTEAGQQLRGDVDVLVPGHLGLHSMRERTAALGAEFAIASAPGEGTLISVRIPLQAEFGAGNGSLASAIREPR